MKQKSKDTGKVKRNAKKEKTVMTAATKISLPEKSFSGSDIFRIWTIEVFADIPKQNNLSTLLEPISSKVKIQTDFPFRAFIDQS